MESKRLQKIMIMKYCVCSLRHDEPPICVEYAQRVSECVVLAEYYHAAVQ